MTKKTSRMKKLARRRKARQRRDEQRRTAQSNAGNTDWSTTSDTDQTTGEPDSHRRGQEARKFDRMEHVTINTGHSNLSRRSDVWASTIRAMDVAIKGGKRVTLPNGVIAWAFDIWGGDRDRSVLVTPTPSPTAWDYSIWAGDAPIVSGTVCLGGDEDGRVWDGLVRRYNEGVARCEFLPLLSQNGVPSKPKSHAWNAAFLTVAAMSFEHLAVVGMVGEIEAIVGWMLDRHDGFLRTQLVDHRSESEDHVEYE